jgi:hypothetical protein
MQTAGFKPNICLTPDSLGLWYINPGYDLVRISFGNNAADTIRLQDKLRGLRFSFANPRHILDDGFSVWMTGQNGVLRYRYGPDSLVAYTINEGLAHSFTFALAQDAGGQVWVSSLGGIDVYEPEADRFEPVYRMSGLTYMDAFGSAASSPDSTLIFLFGNRVVAIEPEAARQVRPPPGGLQVQEIQVNARAVDWRDPDALQDLAHDENKLTFRFDLPLFNDMRRYTFRYRINSGEWIDQAQRNEIVLHGLSSGRYVLDIQGVAGANGPPTDVLSVPFRIRPPFWGTWWFLGGLVAAGFLVTSWYYRRRLEKVRRESELARQIAELEAKALRAQMNPHFVFNALNAIQECIVTKRIDEAYDYLSRFSKLLRAVLEQSDLTDVSLQEELEVLSLYVSLERLRFKDDMTIVVEVDEALDTEFIRIPPMLIQPHLENAIWHGLRHSHVPKRLQLSVRERAEGYLDVVVMDNGIGRARSQALRAQQLGSAAHRSKGSALSADRLALLRKNYPFTDMKIQDQFDDAGEACGTTVELRIPMLPHTA